MADEIINKVANSGLITFDLGKLYPQGTRATIDLSEWLLEGLVLVEKRFRESVINHDFSQYKNTYVNVTCTTDAIIPQWAWMLIISKLTGIAHNAQVGTSESLESTLMRAAIDAMNAEEYQDKRIIIAGCSDYPIPADSYAYLAFKLQPVVKSIFYGEACSSVPVFKRK